jgi:hypothetical protein
MRAALFAPLLALVAFLLTCRLARADELKPEGKGVAVVAADGATDAAWPLAGAIYSSNVLRPPTVDDARARVLAGEPARSPELNDLAELRAGVKGDDAASRQVLAAIADKLSVQGIVVVFAGDPPTARLYDASTRAFDAARYSPDKDGWKSTVSSLERPYLPQPAPLVTNVPKEKEPLAPPPKPTKSKAFYESPWFWGAIGAVLLIGGGVLIATQVQTSDTIHLQLHMP